MLRKLLNLNRNDLLLYLGIIGGTFLAAQIVTACALVFSDARGIPMVSGIILPITACVLIAFAGAANVGVSFGQALRFGQTRRRALGLTAGMTAVQGSAVMLLSLLLTALERLLLPALWLALSGAEKMAHYFGRVLAEDCGLENRRGEEELERTWEKKRQAYDAEIARQQEALEAGEPVK